MRVRSWAAAKWRGLPRWERRLWVAAPLVVAAAFAAPSLASALSDRADLALAFHYGWGGHVFGAAAGPSTVNGSTFRRDPWGRRLCVRGPVWTPRVYSRGPDGEDDEGGGDDVLLSDGELAMTKALDRLGWAAGWACLGLALALHGPYSRRAQHESPAREVPRALCLAAGPTLCAVVAVALLVGGPAGLAAYAGVDRRGPLARIDPDVSLLVTFAALGFGAALAWRLNRPRAGEDERDPTDDLPDAGG